MPKFGTVWQVPGLPISCGTHNVLLPCASKSFWRALGTPHCTTDAIHTREVTRRLYNNVSYFQVTATQIIHQSTFEILEDPNIQRKKTRFFEGELLRVNMGIRCGVFEAFANFQIVGKSPKINNFFFDEKSWKTFRVLKNIWSEKIWLFMTSVQKNPVYFRWMFGFRKWVRE